MRVVALVSGGKDSCFNMMHCIANGHDIVALANLKPETKSDEIDSYMYQTVGHHVIELYAEAMGLPLFRRTIKGSTKCDSSVYQKKTGDEVEDLYELLCDIKKEIKFDAVASGAILSNYQRVRVENVCSRLNVASLAYLWQRDQVELLSEMIENDVHAIVIKVAALGLTEKHLGKTLKEIQPHMLVQKEKFGLNPCGEGGEYETLTLDCPLFCKTIIVDESKVVLHSDDAFAPVAYLSFLKMHLEDKNLDSNLSLSDRLKQTNLKVLKPKYFSDILASPSNHMVLKDTKHEGNEDIDYLKTVQPIVNVNSGRIWISELFCIKEKDKDFNDSITETMDRLKDLVEAHKFSMNDVTVVSLYVSNMKEFKEINDVYKNYVDVNPPSRVCVELSLPLDVIFKLEVVGHQTSIHKKETLFVQSISYWAPANIGPYSQANKIDNEMTYYSGMIGMNPSNLEVVNGFSNQALLSLYHVTKCQNAIGDDVDNNFGHLICYVSDEKYFDDACEIYCQQSMFPKSRFSLTLVAVSCLPKSADIEWQVVTSSPVKSTTHDNDSDNEEVSQQKLNGKWKTVYLTLSEFQENSVEQMVYVIRQKLNGFCKNVNLLKIFYTTEIVESKYIYNLISDLKKKNIFNMQSAISLIPVNHIYSVENVIAILIT